MPHALFIGRTLESFADTVLVPWFSEAGVKAIRSPLPSVVVVPSHSMAARVRELLSERGVAALGVRFWTPSDLRAHLARGFDGLLLEDAADRRLILRSAAEAVYSENKNASAGAIAASPASLSATVDLVEAGGWGSDVIGGEDVRSVLARRGDLMKKSGAVSPHAFAFSVQPAAHTLADLLIVGFGGGHWIEWGTLSSASKVAATTTVLLSAPRQKAEQMDLTWIASWESLGGSSQFIHEDPTGNAHLASRFDELPNISGSPAATAPVEFALCEQFDDEAKAAVASACKALATGSKRVAIVVPRQGALALEIARRAELLGIPHYNGTPAAFRDHVRATTVTRLLAFLSQPSAENFLDLANDSIVLKSTVVPPTGMRAQVEREASSFLFGDALLLAEHLIGTGYERSIQSGKFIQLICAWKARSTVGEYISALAEMLNKIGSPIVADVLRVGEKSRAIGGIEISRMGMAEWLLGKLIESEPSRTTLGSNRFARLQILLPRDAAGLAWDHVILTGQNEGVWPPPAQACPYLGDDALRSLNEQVCFLNRAAVDQVTTDEIHAVREGHALCISPGLERSLVLRDFANLLETAQGMTVTASEMDATKPGLPAYPGEIFSRLYQLVTGKTVGRAQTLSSGPSLLVAEECYPAAPTTGVEQMLYARNERMSNHGISEFEYSLKSAPDWDVSVSCSAWDSLAISPASIFLKSFCGVSASRNVAEEMAWKKVAGVWAHLWIEQVVGRIPVSVKSIGDWNDRIRSVAESFKEKASALLAKYDRSLPAWWTSLWQIAHGQAQQFATSLAAVRGYEYVQCEIVLPRTVVTLADGSKLPLNGRLDLAFFDRLPDSSDGYRGVRMFIFDFKTGSNKALEVDQIRKFEGLQLPLYALAVAALKAVAVDVCILKPGENAEPQLTIQDVKAQNDIWQELSRLIRTGEFGRTQPYRNEFGFSPEFPIACLETGSGVGKSDAENERAAA